MLTKFLVAGAAAVASAAPLSNAGDLISSGLPFVEPMALYSSDGALEVEFKYGVCDYVGPLTSFQTRCYHYEGEPMFPAPTLYVYPGDTLTIKLINTLSDKDDIEYHNFWQHGNRTNLHFHGGHVSSGVPGDSVIELIMPKAEGEAANELTYVYEIPAHHSPGTAWYHPHGHGSATVQTGTGSAGFIIIQDTVEVPDYVRDATEILLNVNHFCLGDLQLHGSQTCLNQDIMMPTDSGAEGAWPNGQETVGHSGIMLVNGQSAPVVTIEAGKWYRKRILLASTLYMMNGHPADPAGMAAAGCQMKLLAKDSIYNLDGLRDVAGLYMYPGMRADFMFKCDRPTRQMMQSQYFEGQELLTHHLPNYVGDIFEINVVEASDASQCVDSDSWYTKKTQSKTKAGPRDCAWVAKKTSKRCELKASKVRAEDACGQSCGAGAGTDSPTWFSKKAWKKKGTHDGCDKIDEFSKGCKERGNDFAESACASSCGTCGDPLPDFVVNRPCYLADVRAWMDTDNTVTKSLVYDACEHGDSDHRRALADDVDGVYEWTYDSYPGYSPMKYVLFGGAPPAPGDGSCEFVADNIFKAKQGMYCVNGCSFELGTRNTVGGEGSTASIMTGNGIEGVDMTYANAAADEINAMEGTPCKLINDDAVLNVGDIMQWEIFGMDFHPVHMHTHPMQIGKIHYDYGNQVAGAGLTEEVFTQMTGNMFHEGDYGDVIQIPASHVTILQPLDYFATPMIAHCHILLHEDFGMMQAFSITGDIGTRTDAKALDPTCYNEDDASTGRGYTITSTCRVDDECPRNWYCSESKCAPMGPPM